MREPKKELQMLMIGFRRRMEELGMGVSVKVNWKRQSRKDGRMTRIYLREPKKELQMVMIGFRRRMEGLGMGVLVDGTRKRQHKRRSNDKDIFERAKERIANDDDGL